MIRTSFFVCGTFCCCRGVSVKFCRKEKEETPLHRDFLFLLFYPIYIIGIILLLQQLLPVLYLFVLHQHVSDRRCNEQRRQCTEYNTQNHGEREAADGITTEDEDTQQYNQRTQ